MGHTISRFLEWEFELRLLKEESLGLSKMPEAILGPRKRLSPYHGFDEVSRVWLGWQLGEGLMGE